MKMPLGISQPMRRSLMHPLVQLRQSKVGLRPWMAHTCLPTQDKVLWGRTLPGKDMLSGLGRQQPDIKVPLSSARTFCPPLEADVGCPGECQGSPAHRQPPDPTSVHRGCFSRGTRENPFLWSYLQNCLCCSCLRRLFSAKNMKMFLRV